MGLFSTNYASVDGVDRDEGTVNANERSGLNASSGADAHLAGVRSREADKIRNPRTDLDGLTRVLRGTILTGEQIREAMVIRLEGSPGGTELAQRIGDGEEVSFPQRAEVTNFTITPGEIGVTFPKNESDDGEDGDESDED